MRAVTRFACGAALTLALPLVAIRIQAQAPRHSSVRRDTWYEFLLRKCNRDDSNYGVWLEQQRRAFLEATVSEPRFWYSFSVTAGLLLMIAIYVKLFLDHRRCIRVTAEMMADLYSHDLYSRQVARQAIEKYNHHIEQCNRAKEIAESGNARPGWSNSEVEGLRTELHRVASQLEATTQDRNKLQEELRQKSVVVADLSTRLDALARKVNGTRGAKNGASGPVSADPDGHGARFVAQINRLQEELYVERQKNKRLKGA